METPSNAKLVRLSDSELTLADPNQDIRGRRVIDSNEEDIGEVDDLLVDERERKVRFLRVTSGGFLGIGSTKFLIPIDAVRRVRDNRVQVDRTRERVASAPEYEPDLVDESDVVGLYGYYGFTPYWHPAYVYPTYPFYL